MPRHSTCGDQKCHAIEKSPLAASIPAFSSFDRKGRIYVMNSVPLSSRDLKINLSVNCLTTETPHHPKGTQNENPFRYSSNYLV